MVWEELRKDLIFTDIEAKNTDDVFDQMGGALTRAGFGKEGYVQGLKDREEEYPTGLNIDGLGVAIPHTPVDYVNASATSIGILKNPVEFVEMGTDDDRVQVKIVFMLCVSDPNAHLEQLQRIIAIIQDKDVMQKLTEVKDPEEIIRIIKEKEEAVEANIAQAQAIEENDKAAE